MLIRTLGLVDNFPEDVLRNFLQESMKNSDKAVCDFRTFASIVYEVLKHRANMKTKKKRRGFRWKTLIPFDPESMPRQTWDMFVLLFILYCSFEVPFSIAFDVVETDETSNSPLQSMTDLVYAVFLLDIVFSFLTAYIRQGVMVTDLRQIARHYLATWFAADFVSSFPFELFLHSYSSGAALPAIKAIKFVRMFKVLKGLKFVNHLSRCAGAPRRAGAAAQRVHFPLVLAAACIFAFLSTRHRGDSGQAAAGGGVRELHGGGGGLQVALRDALHGARARVHLHRPRRRQPERQLARALRPRRRRRHHLGPLRHRRLLGHRHHQARRQPPPPPPPLSTRRPPARPAAARL